MATPLDIPNQSGFGSTTLPYGVFSTAGEEPRIGVALGDNILDLAPLAAAEGFDGAHVFAHRSLNPFMALGRPAWDAVRGWITELVADLADDADAPHRELVAPHLVPAREATMHLPFDVADYVDFYSSRIHAENASKIFRPDSPALPPAWPHVPIGYHGRASTVIVSGTPVVRPSGPRSDGEAVEHGPTTRLDVEAEVGFVVGVPSKLGQPVAVADFAEHVFGVVLVNDWSARDVQSFEQRPLGPFAGKSFATSISPWVTPLAALEQARIEPPARDPQPAAHLSDAEPWGLDIALEVEVNATVVSRPEFADMYWTPAQQLAHLTANGARVRTGDLFASGTVSSPGDGRQGSLLELTWNGTTPITLADGGKRTFLEDGDVVTIRASAPGPDGARISLGEVTGRIEPPPA